MGRAGWDVVVGAAAVVTAAVCLFESSGDTGNWVLLATGGLVVFLAGYLAARPCLPPTLFDFSKKSRQTPKPSMPRTVLVFALLGAGIGVAVIGAGSAAMLQGIGYPIIWVIGGSRRKGVAGSVWVSLCVLAGYVAGGWGDPAEVVFGLLIALVSFGFSIAIGLWITSLSEYANERAALVDDLTSAQAEIAALNRERGAYAERERLARDLHDTLAQSLAGLVMLAERARRQSQEGRTAAATQSTAQLEDVARTALVEARVLVARTAAVPAEPAFGTAVERLVERFRSEAGLVIDLSAADVSADRETQVVVLRCLQEALANVRKHAGASRVSVRVELVGTAVELVVADDGRGFDQDHREGGFGLDGMGERVRIVGGRLDVTSEPGAGTEVRVRLPLPEHAP